MKMTFAELDREPTTFVSPFPTYDDPEQIAQFAALQPSTGTGGYFSMLQAKAWQQTSHINNTAWLTSAAIGGAPTNFLRRMLPGTILAGADVAPPLVKGANLFASAAISPTTDPAEIGLELAKVGLSIALDAASAVPIVGNVLQAVVGIGRFMSMLLKSKTQIKPQVPWFSWNKDFDQDMVNFLADVVMPTVDWTQFWMPRFSAGDLEPRSAPHIGPKALAWASWDVDNKPAWGSGLGMLPGMQQGIGVMQCARLYQNAGDVQDAVTNSNDFLASATQQATVAWSMVSNFGSPLMFQVQPRHLAAVWDTWWTDFFGEGLERATKPMSGPVEELNYRALGMSKIMARWLCYREGKTWFVGLSPDFIRSAGNLPSFMDDVFSQDKNKLTAGRQFYTPAVMIKQACDRLVKSQIAALERTVVCALVRPTAVSESKLPFAAFLDPGPPVKALKDKGYNQNTYGKQLTAYAVHLRKIMESHPARFTLNYRDVADVDPAYAAKLGELFEFGKPQNFAASMGDDTGPGGPDASPQPSPHGPQGQAPFTWTKPKAPPRESGAGRNLVIGAAVVGGVLAYKYRDELRSTIKGFTK